ncbi:MAG: hypothetical protein Q7S84_04945 [bacterium]|nr:hypothetical protein [bacterium]
MKDKKVTIEQLAKMVERGFAGTDEHFNKIEKKVDERFNKVDERFNKVDDDISWIHGSLDVLRHEISEIRNELGKVVYRHELEALQARVATLEKKLGVRK